MTNNEVKVTIGLPFYNNESTLAIAIKSIQAQTLKEWTLILINDGSKDQSSKIAECFLEDKRIVYINDGENLGLIKRLNQLSQLSQTKYLARMDADDISVPERLEMQLNFLEQNTDVDLVDTAMYSMDELQNPKGIRGMQDLAKDPRDILKSTLLNHASIMGKTKWFQKFQYNANFVRAEDYELWLRTHRVSKFARLKIPLYIVREGRVSIKNYVRSMETMRLIFRQYGSGIVKPYEVNIELIKTYLKSNLYRLFGFFGLQWMLSERRNSSLNAEQTKKVIEIITDIS